MYEVEDDKKIEIRKKKILKVGQIFFIMIIILTFTSKSIHNLTLPKVNVQNVRSGSLTVEIVGEGIVKAKERIEYYVDFQIPVKDVMVSVGEHVKKGDVILALDKESLEFDLTKKEIELRKLMLQQEKAMMRNLSNNTNTYEQRIQELEANLAKIEKELTIYQQLFNAGAISRKELNDKKTEFDIEKMKYENVKNEVKVQKEIAMKEKEALNKEMEIMKLDILRLKMEIEEIKRRIESSAVTAPTNGVIKEINFKEGMIVNNTMPLYVLDSPNKGFEIEVVLNSEDCLYLQHEDEGQVFIRNQENSVLTGKIKAIKNTERTGKKIVVIEINNTGLTGGEWAEVYINKAIGPYEYIIPRQALREDEQGKFVYVIQEKEGPLGREYYAIRKAITTRDSDNRYIGVISGLLGDERIIVSSSKLLHDGSEVVIE